MLLIGSRAVRFHFPDAREPLDWDLVGTDEEITRLDRVLPRSDFHAQRVAKVFYLYGESVVEVANASLVPYWKTICDRFEDAPVLDDPILGRLRVPEPAYVLATKQSSLIYPGPHWYKNLEDFFWLEQRVRTVPEGIEDLLRLTHDNAKELRGEAHVRAGHNVQSCHPRISAPLEPLLHESLHELRKLWGASVVAGGSASDAWLGFPNEAKEHRRQKMIDWFAEEVWVLAAEQSLVPSVDGRDADEASLVRWALRELITSHMPEGWRYFGVNHYREIAASIPRAWKAELAHLVRPRPVCEHSTGWSSTCSGAPRQPYAVYSRRV